MSDAQFVCAVILVMVAIYWGAYSVWYALMTVGGSDGRDGYYDPARPRVVAQAPHARETGRLEGTQMAQTRGSDPNNAQAVSAPRRVSASEHAGTTTLTLSQE